MEKCYKAQNGIEIYGYKNPSLHGFFISLFLRGGSMYESDADSGITHFLEHVLVRNVNKIFDFKLYPALDRYGLEFNASTYAEMVQFYLSGASANFKHAVPIVSKLFSPLVLTKSEIEAERRRIKAEIRENDDKNSMSGFAMSESYKDTSLKNFITGTNQSVDKITAKRLEAYRKKEFTRENAFFYVTGNYSDADIDYLLSEIGKISLDEPSSALPRDNIAPIPKDFGKRGGRVAVKNGDYTMVRFNFDLDMKKLTVPATDILYDMLLSGYGSRLFIEMSELRGLFYDISGTVERYRNIGELYFSYELRGKDVKEAIALTFDILNSFKKNPGELMRAGYVDNAGMLYDDARELNFTMAYDNHVMNLGYASLEERIAAYAAVTPDEIRRAACEIFTPKNLTLTVKGSKKKINIEEIENLIFRLEE